MFTALSRQPYFANKIDSPTPTSTLRDAKCCHGYDMKMLEPNSDIQAFVKGLVTVTPMSLDLTSRADPKAIQASLRLVPLIPFCFSQQIDLVLT